MTNVAHGVRGIIWYAYRGYNKNFGVVGNFGEGIVDCGNRSPLIKGSTPQRTEYDAVREINRYLACIVGPAVMASDFVNVYHKKLSGPGADGSYAVFPGQSCIPADQILRAGANDPVLIDISNDNVMAGVFRDKADTSVFYILAVNKNWKVGARPVSGLSLTVKGDMDGKVFCAPRAFGYDGGTAFTPLPATFRPGQGTSSVTLPGPLLSGEGRLVKVIAAGSSPALPAGFRPGGGIAAARNNVDKRIICCARGTDGRVYARVQDTANVDFWGQEWSMVCESPVYGNIACADFGPRSALVIASTDKDGKLQYAFQQRSLAKNRPLQFGQWRTCTTTKRINSNITCSRLSKYGEHLAIFFRCGDTLFYTVLREEGECRGPYPLAQAVSGMSEGFGVGLNCKGTARGSIDLFVVRPTGRIFWARMTASGLLERRSPEFTDFGCSASGNLHVATDPNGTLELFFTGEDGRLSHKRQRSPGSAEWELIDEQVKAYGGLASGIDSDGRLTLFTRDSSGYLCSMTCPGRLTRLGPGPVTVSASPVAVAVNGDGRLTVFALSSGNANVFYSSQGKKGCGVDWQNCLPFTNLSDQDQ
jgi:hypothetical protein